MISAFVTQSNPLTVLARVVDQTGNPITQTSVSSITATVYNAESATETWTATPLVSSCVFNALQTSDPRWTIDSIGYNLAVAIDGSAIDAGETTFQVQVVVTPIAGDAYTVVAKVKARQIFG